ncbi:MAG: lysoplasmalogenase [Syntrophaceae bacterium]|nr:lysoplasmalogenase [Syntrophaceae bacterium]
MLTAAILLSAVPLLAGLLYFRKRDSLPGIALTKPTLSALFVLAALTGPHGHPEYFAFILAGLLFCLAGDVFLISAARKFFLAGLIAFLAGHVLYSIAFFTAASPGMPTVFTAAACVLISGAFFLRIRPYLGTMMLPVLAYVAIITIMVIGAATLMGESELPVGGRALALTGAVLFYLSDLFVARERFVKHEFLNRLIGLPLYYAGQFMIAFSIRLL